MTDDDPSGSPLIADTNKLIISDNCIACALCEPVCPVSAVSEGDEIFEINQATCNLCVGHADSPLCMDTCPVIDCIVKTD